MIIHNVGANYLSMNVQKMYPILFLLYDVRRKCMYKNTFFSKFYMCMDTYKYVEIMVLAHCIHVQVEMHDPR